MTNKNLVIMLAALLAVIIGGGAIFAISQNAQPAPQQAAVEPSPEPELPYPEGGGTLILRVNPEFAIHYDAQGMVVGVDALNDDAQAMGLDLASLEGQECRAAVSALVARINEAGFLVEEVEADGNAIELEVEDGSSLPSNDFLRNIVSDTQTYVVSQSRTAPMQVTGASNYGWTDYSDSDYGPENDGVTDYYDSDYGPLNDGVTDYEAPAQSNSGYTNYSNYGGGTSGGGGGTSTPAPAPTPAPEPEPAPQPTPQPSGGGNSGHSNYGGGGNSGYSNYDDGGNSGHGDSGYDD